MANDYWLKREKKWINQNLKNDDKLAKEIEKHYQKALKAIDEDIKRFYLNYATAAKVSMEEAIKQVGSFDVKNFEKMAAKLVKDKDFSPYANEKLKLYNATMRINRLEYLKSEVGLELVEANADAEQILADKLKDEYMAERKRQSGILGYQNQHDDIIKRVGEVVNADFHGATWSQRIWVNNDTLKAKLDDLLTKSLVQGVGPQELARRLRPLVSKEVKNATYVTQRLARTETARVQDVAQNDAFKKMGIEYVRWVYEPTACPLCVEIGEAHDGVYPLKKAPGIPVHAQCRCSKAAYMPAKDEATKLEGKKIEQEIIDTGAKHYSEFLDDKTAKKIQDFNVFKNEATKSYNKIVKNAVSIKELEKAFKLIDTIDSHKSDLISYLSVHNARIISKYRNVGFKGKSEHKFISRSNKKISSSVNDAFKNLPTDWYKKSSKFPLLTKKVNRGYYSEVTNVLAASTKRTGDLKETVYHELGHRMEDLFPEIKKAEHQFYQRRTKGEKLQKMSKLTGIKDYDSSEEARPDNFLDPYIGKDYGNKDNSFYEIFSMGVEALYSGSLDLTKDKDFANFIIGILLKI